MKKDIYALSMCEAIERIEGNSPADVLTSIPADNLRELPSKICDVLSGNGLSLRQAEALLEVAKSRLKWVKI